MRGGHTNHRDQRAEDSQEVAVRQDRPKPKRVATGTFALPNMTNSPAAPRKIANFDRKLVYLPEPNALR
jgi:hypothetical protein